MYLTVILLYIGVWVCVLDEESRISYWYLLSCEPLNQDETSHENTSPTDDTENSDDSRSSSQSSEDEQHRCNRTVVASESGFTLPDAEVGTQVPGKCFDVYEGNFPIPVF